MKHYYQLSIPLNTYHSLRLSKVEHDVQAAEIVAALVWLWNELHPDQQTRVLNRDLTVLTLFHKDQND